MLYKWIYQVFYVLQPNQVVDMSSAVWMASYESLDRSLCDQVIVDAVASRVGKVCFMFSLIYICH